MAGNDRAGELYSQETVDNPLYNKWLRKETFAVLLMRGAQLCKRAPGANDRPIQLLETLFPGLTTSSYYHAPEALCYSSIRLLKPPIEVRDDTLCPTTFWLSYPESITFRMFATGRILRSDLDFCMHNFQMAMCPRSAILLSTFSFSIFEAQTLAWHPKGHERITLVAVQLPLRFVQELLEAGGNIWNRLYLDHFLKYTLISDRFDLPGNALSFGALYQCSMSFNFLAFNLNQLVGQGYLKRYGHLILPRSLFGHLPDEEHVIPREWLQALFRARL